MVIVGAGEAGARAALALREYGFAGSITLVGEEPHAPYERPPLSKSVMLSRDEPTPKTILQPERLEEHAIDLRMEQRVVAIDRTARLVRTADGSAVAYDKLLIATGSRPRRLPIEGADAALYLRTFSDALALRRQLLGGIRLVIVGGGFIGLEIAAGAIERGCEVTVIEMAPRILVRGVPETIATVVAARHEAAGVRFHLAAQLVRIERTAGVLSVVLADGDTIHCDGVIAGVGAVPETTLAAEAGLDIDNGVKADANLRTSDPHIYAAGDCCSFPHPLYDGRRIRLEAWRNAQDQGAAVARNMLGPVAPYASVPSFWSDQYDQTLQIVGLPDAGAKTVRRDVSEAASLFFHLDTHGRLVAASGVGPTGKIARDIRLAEMLIAQRARPDPAALASPAIRLKSLLTESVG
jgi:3-phenylpropionate/trans-cinnamate dioxygenase ferredoxin reductase component